MLLALQLLTTMIMYFLKMGLLLTKMGSLSAPRYSLRWRFETLELSIRSVSFFLKILAASYLLTCFSKLLCIILLFQSLKSFLGDEKLKVRSFAHYTRII